MLKFGAAGEGVGVGEGVFVSADAKLEQPINNAIDMSNNREIIVLVFKVG
jgi:hypothetical protein